jgi:acyl carrier protein
MTVSPGIHAKVQRVLAECLGVDEDDIMPAARLQDDLGAESIDFLDIVFRLERTFGIKIPRGELFPDSVLGNEPDLVQDQRVTDEGLRLLHSRMPFADRDGLDADRKVVALADLFTVDLLARYVAWKLDGAEVSGSPAFPEVD